MLTPKMREILVILLSSFILLTHQVYSQAIDEKESIIESPSNEVISALMVSCYVCHNPSVKYAKDVIAPPLVMVKHIYKMRYPEEELFVEKITDFVMYPTNLKAIMQGAVMKFGVMPDMPLDETQVRQIAAYIYKNEVIEPNWFPEEFESRFGEKWKGQ